MFNGSTHQDLTCLTASPTLILTIQNFSFLFSFLFFSYLSLLIPTRVTTIAHCPHQPVPHNKTF